MIVISNVNSANILAKSVSMDLNYVVSALVTILTHMLILTHSNAIKNARLEHILILRLVFVFNVKVLVLLVSKHKVVFHAINQALMLLSTFILKKINAFKIVRMELYKQVLTNV